LPIPEELDSAHTLLRHNPAVGITALRVAAGFAIGRDNWSFFGDDNGGKTAAVLRSFVTSCELAKIDPFAWFRDVLSRIANYPVKWLSELLPHRWINGLRQHGSPVLIHPNIRQARS
jgi:hypothetical protein